MGTNLKCDCCGVCCVAVSIHSPQLIKPAGIRCKYLTPNNLCSVWGTAKQPEVCRSIKPMNDLCRFDLRLSPDCTKRHYKYLTRMERATR